jgi:hypothetical protein
MGLLFVGESGWHCVLVRLDLARIRHRIPLQRLDQSSRTSEVGPRVVPQGRGKPASISGGKNKSGRAPKSPPRM